MSVKDEGLPWSMKWRLVVSIVGCIGGLAFLTYYLAFVPNDFTLFQSLAVIFIAILLLSGVAALIWIPWTPGMAKEFKRMNKYFDKM